MNVTVCLRSYCLAVKKPFQPQLTMADKEWYFGFMISPLVTDWCFSRNTITAGQICCNLCFKPFKQRGIEAEALKFIDISSSWFQFVSFA